MEIDMLIYPAIDIKNGRCVRLQKGDMESAVEYGEPFEMAKKWQDTGASYLHVVDLDGAFEGSPHNHEAIREIAASISIPFQVGGGLRTRADVDRILDLGASRVIIGTKAVKSPDFIKELLLNYGPGKIVLGLDAKDGLVAIEGWVEKSSLQAIDFGKTMRELGIETAIYTDVSRDGLLQGPNLQAIEKPPELPLHPPFNNPN
jgi:phosphoribosylformimino-5-aminoimidazole carboxamide ribotide isomerase